MKRCLACNQRFTGEEWQCPTCGQAPQRRNGYLLFAPKLSQGDGSDVEYKYAELFQAEAGHFWFRARNQLLIWALRRYFPQAANFLEIGCGTGFVLTGIQQALPQLQLSASDILTRGLTYTAQRLPEATLFQMDARRIPFEVEFDVIGAFDMLEHISQDEVVLTQMFKATRPGGGIILTVPQHQFLWSYMDDFSQHKRRYTRPELVGKVEQAGFQIMRVTSFVSLLLPLLFVSRLTQRKPQQHHNVMAEFKISSFLNASLEKMLAVERMLIELGLSFPTGGSLLIIANRPGQ